MASVAKNAQELVSKTKLTTCKRCGMSDLAWAQSTVTGKWFLCPTTERKMWASDDSDRSLPKGYVLAIKMRPHRCGESEAKAARDQEFNDNFSHNQRMAMGELGILTNVYTRIAGDTLAVALLAPFVMDAGKREYGLA